MKNNLEKEFFFNKISEELQFDIMDYFQIEDLADINNFDELTDELQENNAFTIEIIYYATAMKYLTENDTSLTESLELASDFGYETKNLNSELLASILASENSREEFYELHEEIEDFFEEQDNE
jgi:hypothetical protein|tara:strand:- start:907 stop:1278 length:372 start_codon:yes stop_codon:yes gene_type:complete